MSDSENDEDFKRAIALSLGENPSPPPRKEKPIVIDLDSTSDDDDDLDAAPAKARKAASEKVASNKKYGKDNEGPTTNAPSKTRSEVSAVPEADTSRNSPRLPDTPAPFLGLDRKQMEEERLLRIQQRKNAEMTSSMSERDGKKRKASTPPPEAQISNVRQVKAKLSEPITAVQPSKTSSKALPILSFKDQERALHATGMQYPDGVVKKTWVYGYPRKDDIKIEEVLQKDNLELAVLSAFQIDPEWIASKLRPETKVVFVLQAKTEAEKENIRSDAPDNYKFCFPSMEGNINCMHSKLQLLSYPTHLRVVVPSANLVPYDWGETGTMENVCFLIDLPRLSERKQEDGELTEFAKELFHFVQAMGLGEKLIGSLRKFDFSRTSHLAFVHSIGGSHSGKDMKRTGYCGLGTAVRNLGLHTEGTIDVDIVAASIGNLNDGFIKSIYLATQGDDGMKEYGWRMSRPAKSKAELPAERELSELLKSCFRIYFPSRETVENSKGGLGAAGTICFQSKWYDLDTFPKHLMRDCQSQRGGLVMHNKMIFVQPRDGGSEAGKAWAYVGSANLSESAWGRIVKDRSTKGPRLNCRNWECGVLVCGAATASWAGAVSGQGEINQHDLARMEFFGGDGVVPVPMVVPGEMYRTRPWFYNEV